MPKKSNKPSLAGTLDKKLTEDERKEHEDHLAQISKPKPPKISIPPTLQNLMDTKGIPSSGVLEAACQAFWHEPGKCPADKIPTLDDLNNLGHKRLLYRPGSSTEEVWQDLPELSEQWLRFFHEQWRWGVRNFIKYGPDSTELPELPVWPLVDWIREWWELPPLVQPDSRVDTRILPRIEYVAQPAREVGMLFGGVHQNRVIKQRSLPLFDEVPGDKIVPLLDLVDASGVPVMAQGKGAPLELRFAVRSMITVQVNDRSNHVRMAVSLRELKEGLFPNGWQRNRDWPRLKHVLETSREYAIHDGQGRWYPIALRYMPDNPGLDDVIEIDIAFPAGAKTGPIVSLPKLDELSVKSAPQYRAYIAAHSLLWRPGITRVPVPGTSGKIYGWASQETAYPILTEKDRTRLAFGPSDRKHRQKKEVDAAFLELPGIKILDTQAFDLNTGSVGWRIAPDIPNQEQE